MPMPTLLTILVTVTLSAFAQLALKLGVMSQAVKHAGGGLAFALAVAARPAVWLGLGVYAASVVLWLWVLSRTELSVAYPFVGVSFLVTMTFGALLLHEQVTPARIAGTLLVAAGCVLVARSA